MPKLYGITSHSMLQVQQHVLQHNPDYKILLIHYNLKRLRNPAFQKKISKADLIMIDSVRTLNSAITLLNDTRQVLAVFDSPLLLAKQANIHFLDNEAKDDPLQFRFTESKLKYDELYKSIQERQLKHNLIRDKTDTLAEIIKSYSNAGLLDKYNTFLYQASNNSNRTKFRRILVEFIFGDYNENVLKQSLLQQNKNVMKHNDLLQKIINFVNSALGQQLQLALKTALKMENAVKANSRRPIAYKKLADEFHVDKFELRNLILLYRQNKTKP